MSSRARALCRSSSDDVFVSTDSNVIREVSVHQSIRVIHFLRSVYSFSLFSSLPIKRKKPRLEILFLEWDFRRTPRRTPRPPDNNVPGGRGRHWHNQAAAAPTAMPGRPARGGTRGYGGAGRRAMDREEEGHGARRLPRRPARPDDHG